MGGRGTTRRYRGGANSSCTQTPGAQERTRLLPTRPLEEISLRWVRTEAFRSFCSGGGADVPTRGAQPTEVCEYVSWLLFMTAIFFWRHGVPSLIGRGRVERRAGRSAPPPFPQFRAISRFAVVYTVFKQPPQFGEI